MTAMIDIRDAEKTFTMHLQGGVELPVVRGVSFQVRAGECVVLSGPSGAGKSSILKMIFGNYRCDGGRIGIRHEGALIDQPILDFAAPGLRSEAARYARNGRFSRHFDFERIGRVLARPSVDARTHAAVRALLVARFMEWFSGSNAA